MRRGRRRSQIEGRWGSPLVRRGPRSGPGRACLISVRVPDDGGGERCSRRPNSSYTRIVTRTVRRTTNPANTAESTRHLPGQTVEAEDRVNLDRVRRDAGLSVLVVEEGDAGDAGLGADTDEAARAPSRGGSEAPPF